MLARLPHSGPARLAAGLLLVSLTGAPRVVAALADRSEHRCTCAALSGEHRCECPICKARATHAHEARQAKKPPCHRAATPPAEERPLPPPAGAPCLSGACGAPDAPRAVVSGLEPFTLAADGSPALLVQAEPFAPPAGAVRIVPCSPDPPPPRA